jgi:hypothetical protein
MPIRSNTRITTQCKGRDHASLAAVGCRVTASTDLITALLPVRALLLLLLLD